MTADDDQPDGDHDGRKLRREDGRDGVDGAVERDPVDRHRDDDPSRVERGDLEEEHPDATRPVGQVGEVRHLVMIIKLVMFNLRLRSIFFLKWPKLFQAFFLIFT